MFSKQDIDQYTAKGISQESLEHQLEKFNTGFPFSVIVRSASPGDGLLTFSENAKKTLISGFDQLSDNLSLTKFVPASGAATRMFKSLFSALEKLDDLSASQQQDIIAGDKEISTFFKELERYPFYKDLKLDGGETPGQVLHKLLDNNGLSYGALPKGLLKFHSYAEGSRTAFEEHLREAAGYCAQGATVNMHFTISPEHEISFTALQNEIVSELEKEYSVTFHLTYSFQKEETDTIAVDNDNQPFRDEKGKLVFRPGGHGALLENLNEISGDIVFISNIDNVAPDKFKDVRIENKKYLGAILLQVREEINSYLEILKSKELRGIKFFNDLFSWMNNVLYITVPTSIADGDLAMQRAWAIEVLDRPFRVCGMVKNEGEPGGGPFFVKDDQGRVTLQILETSQIDMNDHSQKKLLLGSTHFNPVDLVCSTRNHKGEKFNLMDFRDPDTGFITSKSMLGKDLQAQELPGLWNGSMAHWTTIFVELPMSTFTPVKTVFDLTRPEHQS